MSGKPLMDRLARHRSTGYDPNIRCASAQITGSIRPKHPPEPIATHGVPSRTGMAARRTRLPPAARIAIGTSDHGRPRAMARRGMLPSDRGRERRRFHGLDLPPDS